MNEETKKKILFLFKEKNFDAVLDLTNSIKIQDRPAGLENIIGISLYNKKNLSLDDLKEAFLCFERAFLKEKNSEHGLKGLGNIIKLGIKVSPRHNIFSSFLYKASKYYISIEENYEKNEEFLTAGIFLFSYLLDQTKINEITKKIFSLDIKSKFLNSVAIFENNYNSNLKQIDHFNFALNNSKNFFKLKVKNLKNINYILNSKVYLGFVACDFERNHSITFFIKDVFKYLDRKNFKIFTFSLTEKNENDESQNELRKFSDQWFDVQNLSNQELAELIQTKKINILIDLMGHTKGERLELFNSRIAPKQISWMAYCNTSGLDHMDYLIVDPNLIKKEEEKFYTEEIIYLPDIWSAHSGFHGNIELTELPSQNSEFFTFGSLNNFRKISDEVVEVWSNILQKTPNSKLILKSSSPHDNESLLYKFKKYQVDHKIQIFNKFDFLNKKDHLNLYKKIDLCLDTFPYNGVTTTFEALWMNVPVLVMSGYNFNSRCGESIIKNLKLETLISKNKSNYIDKAITLYNNQETLSELKKKIHQDLKTSSLFNTKKFTKNFSDILLDIHLK